MSPLGCHGHCTALPLAFRLILRSWTLGDVEAVEAACGPRPFDLDGRYARHARALPRCPLEQFEVPAAALRDELDRSVVPICHPARQPQRLRTANQEVPEPDSLDVTSDEPVKALRFHPSSIVPSMAVSAIVAIGDELVGGFTLETNSQWLAERLRILGYPVKRITAIRDRPEEIVEQLRRELADSEVTHIFCSGGLGPTPDDRTFASVADALGSELVIWEETRERIQRRVRRMHEAGLLESPEVTEGNLRMARIPDGPAQVLKNRRGMAPGVVYEAQGKLLFI